MEKIWIPDVIFRSFFLRETRNAFRFIIKDFQFEYLLLLSLL